MKLIKLIKSTQIIEVNFCYNDKMTLKLTEKCVEQYQYIEYIMSIRYNDKMTKSLFTIIVILSFADGFNFCKNVTILKMKSNRIM